MNLFSMLYFVIGVVLYIIALPLLMFLSSKHKYKQSIPARFFLYNNPKFDTDDGIWFHVCSLGESKALQPILELIKTKDVKITTITQTGQTQAKKYDADVRYLPFELFLPFWIKKQKLLVVLEAEFWYLLFMVASAKGSKIVLLNARISDKSVDKYLKFRWFYKKILSKVDTVYAQSEVDRERFLALGATNIEVIGNIKLAQKITKTVEYEKPSMECIVAGSTHEYEEESILNAFIDYRSSKDSKLIVVPRHPERFGSVYELMELYAKKNSLTLSRFSDSKNFDADLVLVDMMGELNNIYAISDIAIVGGAFRDDVGGHNPLEPAFFGCKIITGRYYYEQKELFKYVENVQVVETDDIAKALQNTANLSGSFVGQKIDLEPIVTKILNN